jgi:hypothetical protein
VGRNGGEVGGVVEEDVGCGGGGGAPRFTIPAVTVKSWATVPWWSSTRRGGLQVATPVIRLPPSARTWARSHVLATTPPSA